jgi:hypothetical protein
MKESMAEDSPATKGDIVGLGENLRALLKDELGGIERRLHGMDQRFDAVDRRFEEVGQRFDRLEHRLNEGLHEVEVRLTKRMDDFAASLEEQIRDSQTEVLRAMLTTQEANLLRFKDFETLRERMAVLERRLLEIEVRLRIPPAAA